MNKYEITCKKNEIMLVTGAEPPPVNPGTSPSSPTFFVVSSAITRTFNFFADLPSDFCINSAGNTFPADFVKDLGSQVR